MTPHYDDGDVTVYHGDCLDVLRELPDASVDAVVTDPPYGLEFMGKEWDSFAPADMVKRSGWEHAQSGAGIARDPSTPQGRTGVSFHKRRSTYKCGRCGKRDAFKNRQQCGGSSDHDWQHEWVDKQPVEMLAFQQWCQLWAAECLRVLRPGGHLLAFGGTRTYHRMACAIEDAGFEIRDSIHWTYGSGFPKSLDVSKAIDKAAGATREVVGQKRVSRVLDAETLRQDNYTVGVNASGGDVDITAPATDAARQWDGWGTALKPSHEPVICARKPFRLVPLWQEVSDLHHLIGALLWLSVSPAKRAALSSTSSQAGQPEATCASALASAAMDSLLAESAKTDTSNSQAAASTCLSIATSWSAILDALSTATRTSTTSTESSTTTGLRTLKSLLAPITSQTTMPRCGCLVDGGQSSAANAASTSSDEWSNWMHTLSASVPESAIDGIALVVASALAPIAASLSGDQAAASSADPTATTEADARNSVSHEPIVVARKPLVGTVAGNVLAHGTGAINVDGCRVGTTVETWPKSRSYPFGGDVTYGSTNAPTEATGDAPAGRWPANTILTHAPDCDPDGGCGAGCPCAEMDAQSGVSTSVGVAAFKPRSVYNADAEGYDISGTEIGYGDTGGASRFFPAFYYTAKASSAERPRGDGVAHPTVKPLDLMRWLVRLVTPPGGVVLEPFAGSGTTAEACVVEGFRCIAIEREADYLPLIVARLTKPIERTLL